MNITDDRGGQVKMGEVSFARLRSGNPFSRLVSLRADIERKSGPKVESSETLGLVFVAAVFLVFGSFLLLISISLLMGVLAIVLGIALLAAGITRKWTFRREVERSQHRFHNAWNETPLCLGCEYVLRGIPPEPDGCTVCPECGAAWRLTSMSPDPAVAAARQTPEAASSRRV